MWARNGSSDFIKYLFSKKSSVDSTASESSYETILKKRVGTLILKRRDEGITNTFLGAPSPKYFSQYSGVV